MNIKIDKKGFYKQLRSLGRDIRHGIMCNKVCFDPFGECDCYWANVEDSDINWINKRLSKFKNHEEAVRTRIDMLLKKADSQPSIL